MFNRFIVSAIFAIASLPAFAESALSNMEINEIARHTTATSRGYNAPNYELILTDIKAKDHNGFYLVMLISNGVVLYGTADSMTAKADFFIQWGDGSTNIEKGELYKLTPLGEKYRAAGER